MQKGYTHSSTQAVGEWRKARTDDVMFIEDNDSMTLVFLGTQSKLIEWAWNFAFRSKEWLNMGRVHRGFARNVIRMLGRQDQEGSLLNRCLSAAREGKKIFCYGHSRGHPLSCLTATWLVANGVPQDSITIVGCAGARVGNSAFNAEFEKMFGGRAFVLNAINDPVPYLPPWGKTNGKVTKINMGWLPKHSLEHYLTYVTDHINGAL